MQQPTNTYCSWISTPPTALLLLSSIFLTALETSSASPSGAQVPTIIPERVTPELRDMVLEMTDSTIWATFGRPGVNESPGKLSSISTTSEVARV